jgi:hypothetical protein
MPFVTLLVALATASELSVTAFVPGESAEFRITAAPPGATVLLFGTLSGEGEGPCSGDICLDLAPPLRTLARLTAGADGTATQHLVVPPIAGTAWVQAAVHGPEGWQVTSVVASDRDADGVPDPTDACPDDHDPMRGRVWLEGEQHASIQSAVEAAPVGALIELCPATYAEALVLHQDLTLRSLGDATNTTIHAGGLGAAVKVDAGAVTLAGLSFTGGTGFPLGPGHPHAGGVGSISTSPLRLEDCAVFGNTAMHGGGLFSRDGELVLVRTEVHSNVAEVDGGGIHARMGLQLVDSQVHHNLASDHGGGITLVETDATLDATTEVWANEAPTGGGAYLKEASLEGGWVHHNEATEGGGLAAIGSVQISRLSLTHNQAELGGGIAVLPVATGVTELEGTAIGFAHNLPHDLSIDGEGLWFGPEASFLCTTGAACTP